MPSLAHYLHEFATLRRAPVANSPLTRNRYPNKPLLLLSILDLIGAGFFRANRIHLAPEVTETFDRYWGSPIHSLTRAGSVHRIEPRRAAQS